jgi:hypothetical protein
MTRSRSRISNIHRSTLLTEHPNDECTKGNSDHQRYYLQRWQGFQLALQRKDVKLSCTPTKFGAKEPISNIG